MAKLDLRVDGNVAIVTMQEDDNKLNLDMCASLLDMLDRVEQQTEAVTLVVTSGHDRIWSNGFDTDWIEARLAEKDTAAVMQFFGKDIELRRRLLLYPLTTVCAINGHVFGGGAVLSLCFDFRLMRSDRGYFCIPVVDRGYPILPGTSALLKQVLPPHMIEALVLTGWRYTASECQANGIVTAAHDNAMLMEKSIELARAVSKSRWIVGELKKELNGGVAQLMEKDCSRIEPGTVRV
jgi:Delta3-Delta2-enoyl-CoA isomerase